MKASCWKHDLVIFARDVGGHGGQWSVVGGLAGESPESLRGA